MNLSIFRSALILGMVCLVSFQEQAYSGEVTKNQALIVAEHVVQQFFPADRQSFPVVIQPARSSNVDTDFYICSVGDKGFVLVAKNDHCPPVLGFSWESNFPVNSETAPVWMQTLVNNIHNQCDRYNNSDTLSSAVAEKWQACTSKKAAMLTTGSIAPMLATSWNCDSTFFDLYPKSWVKGGSVPIAMGQVFKYYGRPNTGVEELCYELIGVGDFCTKFDQYKFNFSRMSNTVGNPAVDSLIFCMSVACHMQPTGASPESYVTTLPKHFLYSPDIKAIDCWSYNLADVMYTQLTLRHPVLAEWVDHAFVVDGYFPDNLFHFNMGLGGTYNGFYLLDNSVVKVDTDHSILTCYTDVHPISTLQGVFDVSAVSEGDNVRVSWSPAFDETLASQLVKFVVLRDGLIKIGETTENSILLSASAIGGSCRLRVVADFGTTGVSDLSEPFLYISNQEIADIPSIRLRRLINSQLGSSDQVRQPLVGELELIKDLEIDFPDQTGIEKLPNLRDLRIDGADLRTFRDGAYLENLKRLIFYDCQEFDFTIFNRTRSLLQLNGYDYYPFDLYDFRNNSNLGWLRFYSTGTRPNMLMDLYGADKYFPKLADFNVYHVGEGISGTFEDCFVSYESYLSVYPKIKSNVNLLAHTKPSALAPCYPTPSRDANVLNITRLSWQGNFSNVSDVYYNVFVGKSRDSLDLMSIFQAEKYYDGSFEANRDYYWRVEAFHSDSTYYSGIYHFSTWQDLPIPFKETFDQYYSACPVTDESPFWKKTNNALSAKALTNGETQFEGFYSLELKPQSDAGLQIQSPKDSIYYIEFRVLNQGGQLAAELLQKSGSSDGNVINAKIEFLGAGIGLMTYESATFPFSFIPDQWNRVNIALNMRTGLASFSLNEVLLKEWQWTIQMGGTGNTNLFKGIHFANNAGGTGGSGFIDNLKIDYQNPASAIAITSPKLDIAFHSDSRELILTGIVPSAISEIALYDLQGRKVQSESNPLTLMLTVDSAVPNGIYLVVVNRKSGLPFSRKIAVVN